MKTVFIALIRAYQWLLFPVFSLLPGGAPLCRFHPSCSRYAIEALEIHGVCRGLWLTAKRLARCHPWGGQGADPVPPRDATSTKTSV